MGAFRIYGGTLMERRPFYSGWLAAGILAATVAVSWPVAPAGAGAETRQERQHERADALRERAKDNARRNLGYRDVQDPEHGFDRNVDFYSLGQQIKRLGAMIQRLADPAAAQVPPLAKLGTGGPDQPLDVAGIYGPDGPTVKSVRLLLEYRLLVAGNPRLTVGKVADTGDGIIAEVVTADGSLVEKYAVDKKSGAWSPVR